MKFKLLLFLLTILSFPEVFGQFVVKGKVRDTSGGQPIPGVSVSVNESKGTITDSDGFFDIQSDKKVDVLKVSHLGYATQLLNISDASQFVEISLSQSAGQDLGEVKITSKYYKEYNLNTVSSALRLQSPLINLSQNIQEIGSEVLYDQAVFNMTDGVTRNVSGVIRQEVSNNLGPYMFMRGGMVSTLRNGIDLTPIYRGPVPEDAAIIDRVEFIKGPSGFMNNIGDPAGTFNVMTKQPTGGRHYSVNAMLGSWDFYRASVDLDGLLDKKGKLRYRLNVMGMRANSFVNTDFNKRLLVAPVIKYLISDQTTVSIEYMFQKFSYAMMSPIVMAPDSFGSLPNDFTINEKSLDPYKVSDHTGFLTFTHSFNKNWSATARGSFMRNQLEGIYMWVTGVNTANPNILLRNPKYDLNRATVFSQQVFVNGKIKTGSIDHQILGGVDVNQKKFIADSYVSYDTQTNDAGVSTLTYYPLDILNPGLGAQIPDYHTPGGIHNGNTNQKINYYSIYAIDELAFFNNKLRLTLGGRFTAVKTNNIVSKVETKSEDQKVTPRLGLSYSLTPNLSFYLLYDRTIVPQTGATVSGDVIKPLTGVNHEIGIKKNWFDSRWNTTLALYKIKRANIVSTDPDNILYRIQVGETSSKGIDLDIKGEIVNGLNIVINYAYNDSKVEHDVNTALIGMRTPMYVKHVQNTWINYELPSKMLNGFSVSLGYQYQAGRGERYVTAAPKEIPDFFRMDGGVGYQIKKFKVNLIVNNLLNKHLIATPWYRSGLYYWVPQASINGRLSFSYTF
ncbi:TonB-dependent receptor [Dyadobacter sp. CY345]|uniref:TonB-dependent receptor domain-containing protein n=1 Tax=Dyadobacter sp. CY345 TaxID=2909335 RepID=UPI001F37E6C3|nr:TonB-dependent receptor [Dyadobacter sp. CY345]MCF2447009.1 TonB-dependent receptor [Dyadobacter sp. CY345]